MTQASSVTLLATRHDSVAGVNENSGHQEDSAWWKENSTVIIAILSVAVVAIRLMGVARGDPAIAYAAIQAGGTGSVLIGTLVSTLGLLAIPAFAAFLFSAIKSTKHSVQRHTLLAATFGVLYIAIYTAPADFLALGAVETLFAAIIWRLTKKPEKPWNGRLALSICICIYISLMVLYEVASPTPWLPVQAISVAGQKPFSGYVLSQADGKTTILTSNPDGVISVPSGSALVATQCTPHFYVQEQATVVYLYEHWRRKLTNYPPCPADRYSQSRQARGP